MRERVIYRAMDGYEGGKARSMISVAPTVHSFPMPDALARCVCTYLSLHASTPATAPFFYSPAGFIHLLCVAG